MRIRIMLSAAALTLLCGSQAFADVVVSCGPGQHAVVRDTGVRGDSVNACHA